MLTAAGACICHASTEVYSNAESSDGESMVEVVREGAHC